MSEVALYCRVATWARIGEGPWKSAVWLCKTQINREYKGASIIRNRPHPPLKPP